MVPNFVYKFEINCLRGTSYRAETKYGTAVCTGAIVWPWVRLKNYHVLNSGTYKYWELPLFKFESISIYIIITIIKKYSKSRNYCMHLLM